MSRDRAETSKQVPEPCPSDRARFALVIVSKSRIRFQEQCRASVSSRNPRDEDSDVVKSSETTVLSPLCGGTGQQRDGGRVTDMETGFILVGEGEGGKQKFDEWRHAS